ncbi:DUF2199 domain-containing protein [Chryseobacterium salivictor]|uniref:DUF2199 domain-containing protein n=1 Tax=Chryseobacterium salivictor TaxID=2547600 RepID=A0A4P6ZEY2_9FLAO|nr:DUF2199 domain-containing protein [Chryseobacterium salivictor]QBO58151.1 hypothetical protein NBC122_01324 [Chryseobacterium salivictor]
MNSKYKCSVCGEIHHDYPALTFAYPNSYHWLTEEQKNSYPVHIDSDFCTIEYPDRTDRFIRVVLKQKIAKSALYLEYGLWVSLSEESYEDYAANFNNENHETLYFGWLSNALPDYKFEKSIPMDVKTKSGNQRPEIYPHLDFDHPFVHDFYHGITKEEAEKRIHNMLSNSPK